PIVPPSYGVNAQGSGDMYPKGGNMLHTIRQIVGNDEKWRAILRGLNTTFRHQTVTGREVEDYISAQAGTDLSKVFQQYLTTTKIPVLEYHFSPTALFYRWTDVVPGFSMQLPVTSSRKGSTMLHPTTEWQSMPVDLTTPAAFRADPNYYVITREGAVS
ncbi:MAG: M1 family peptidase, partial [Gemmatimonadota bacterium]